MAPRSASRTSGLRRWSLLVAVVTLSVLLQAPTFLSGGRQLTPGGKLQASDSPITQNAQRRLRVSRVAAAARGGADDEDDDDDDDDYEFDMQYTSMSQLSPGTKVDGFVTRVLERGCLVDIGVEKEGFVPISKMADKRVDSPAELVREGDGVTVWVVEVVNDPDPRNSKIVLSMSANKVIDVRNLGPQADLEVFKAIPSDQYLDGIVVNVRDFGSFVSVRAPGGQGQNQGLLANVNKQDGADTVGAKVKVRIQNVDVEQGRMSLSMKGPAPGSGPLDLTAFKKVGQNEWLPGVVKRMLDFGAFVEVTPPGGGQAASGLLHISQIQDGVRVEDPAEVLEMNQEVQVRVLEVNDRGLSLSMLKPKESQEPAESKDGEAEPSSAESKDGEEF
eukprot:TRINITY_DN87749_c0_g1_i1.p1 TRINITY_DN87749_c0_g1~~TRINITY_DN87749_c0_g1_i1.p1  ORF type:complete len:401 (-),score=70.76 TRINITY_DN87749_c0_g1_i1:46-1212(-)